MSVPTFVGQTDTVVQSTGAGSVAWPVGHLADDIGILLVQTSNEAVATPSGWTACPDSPQGAGTAAVAGSTRISAFWKRATSAAEADASVADAGDHIRARILAFRGCETSGSPFDTSAGSALGTADTAVSIPGGTTTGIERLILAIVANGTDGGGNQTTAGGWANSDLTNLTRISTGQSITGLGGGWDAATGEKATAGAFGATTTTLATASLQGKLMLALKPPSGGGGGAVTEGGIYVATGVKAVAGAISATTATLDASSAQARIIIALKPPTAAPPNLPPVLELVPDQFGVVNMLLNTPVRAVDPEGVAVTYALSAGATSVPTGLVIVEDEDSGRFLLEWLPTADQVGEWNVTLEASDGVNTVTQAFNITIFPLAPSEPTGISTSISVIT